MINEAQVTPGFRANLHWVANRDDATVSRIDPARGAVTATIDVDDSSLNLAVGQGSVWVEGDGRVSRIDPATNSVTAAISVGDDTLRRF